MEPGEGAFDDPAVAAQARAVPCLAAGDLRSDSALAQLAAVAVVVVAAVGEQPVRSLTRPTDLAAHRRYSID